MKQDQLDGISIVEDYIGYNDLKEPVMIPYKITWNREICPRRFGFSINSRFFEWKFPVISKVETNLLADIHGGVAIGNFILKVENKSLKYLSHQTIVDEITSVRESSVTFELNIAMRANLNSNELDLVSK